MAEVSEGCGGRTSVREPGRRDGMVVVEPDCARGVALVLGARHG